MLILIGAWSKWHLTIKPSYLYSTDWHNVTTLCQSVLGNFSFQKYHLTKYHNWELLLSKIPPHKNGTQHKWHLTKMASHKSVILQLTARVSSFHIKFYNLYPHPYIPPPVIKSNFPFNQFTSFIIINIIIIITISFLKYCKPPAPTPFTIRHRRVILISIWSEKNSILEIRL